MSEALGMIECRSFPAMVEASDAMVKAARVELVSYEKTGGGYSTAVIPTSSWGRAPRTSTPTRTISRRAPL